MIEPSLTAFIGFPLALVCTSLFTEYVTYITKYMSSMGIIMNFGRLRDILLNLLSMLDASTSHAKVPSKAPLPNVFEDLYFLSHYQAASRTKRLVARSINGTVI